MDSEIQFGDVITTDMEIYYIDERVQKFIETIDTSLRPRMARLLDLLAEHGNNLGMPYSKALGGGLFELRIIGVVHIRLVYAFHGDVIWILHGFVKKTDRISRKDLLYARDQFKKLAFI